MIFKNYHANYSIRERLHASSQGVDKLFVLAYAHSNKITDENSYGSYFLPRLKIKNYNIEIDVEIFMINQLMTCLNNMMKFEKHQQNKTMIILLVVY